jgi:hypothetical protein
MSAVRQLAVFAENRPGQLARLTRLLAGAGINLRWITIATIGDFGVMRLVVDRTEEAYRVLQADGLMVSQREILAVEAEDRPGTLAEVAALLAEHRVNVENSSGFMIRNRVVLLLEVGDVAQAATLMASRGIRVLTEAEMVVYG